ncbi:transposase [Natrinema gelatinilyticum]|uniref:transposase n=1 Tax=Natrinema gelatinilyticum TaxID=2961571 RepID=UPI002114B698|nr:transposase [Natrinema gelatinilyticum]
MSSWARRAIIENIEYRADIAGVHVERVYAGNTSRSCPRCGSTGHTTKSPDHYHEAWHGGQLRCDNSRCAYQADRDYVGAVNVARVFFSNSATLDSNFTSSYTGDCEIELAGRSAGSRPTFGTTLVAYVGQSRVTAGGRSAFIAPAVTPTGTKNVGSSKSSVSSPATHSYSRFLRDAAVCC